MNSPRSVSNTSRLFFSSTSLISISSETIDFCLTMTWALAFLIIFRISFCASFSPIAQITLPPRRSKLFSNSTRYLSRLFIALYLILAALRLANSRFWNWLNPRATASSYFPILKFSLRLCSLSKDRLPASIINL